MRYLILCLSVYALISCSQKKETQDVETPGKIVLKKLWETDTVLTTAESSIYDPTADLIYVSCIGAMPPIAKDGDGFIAQVNRQGEVVNERWITGIHAPKGMAIVDGKLFVSDIDALISIDIATGKIETSTIIPNARFLNDVAADENGGVYISDSDGETVYLYKDSQFTPILSSDTLGRPNGLFVDGEHLMMLTSGSGVLAKVDVEDKKFKVIASGMPSGDGIVKYKGQYILSSWKGVVYTTGKNGGNVETLLDTSVDKINSADISLIEKEDMLLVPTFFGNSLVAYGLTLE